MLPDLSRQILSRIAEGAVAERVTVSVKDGELTYAWDAAPQEESVAAEV
jgi:hypothetical protein